MGCCAEDVLPVVPPSAVFEHGVRVVGTRLFRLFQPRLHGSERQGTVIDFDTNDEQPLVRVVRDGRGSACAISDEDPLIRSQVASIPVPSTIPAESPLPTWLDVPEMSHLFQQYQVWQIRPIVQHR